MIKFKDKFILLNIPLIFILAFIAAYFSHWQIFEQDVFWLTRAGAEILNQLSVQTVDSWSFTAQGQTWYHFQWLTSIVFYFSSKILGGIENLGYLRSSIIFFIFIVLGFIFHRANPTPQRSVLYLLLFLPCLYLMNWIRLQLRPDLFGFLFFSILVALRFSSTQNSIISPSNALPTSSSKLLERCSFFSSKYKNHFSILILWLWANFHAGTVILGIFYFLVSLFFELFPNQNIKENPESRKAFLKFLVLSLIAWFLTPIHFHILEVLFETTQVTTANPDLQPFSLKFLSYSQGGWGYLFLCIFLVFTLLYLVFTDFKKHSFKNAYDNKTFVSFIGLTFLILFLQKMRTVPYLTVSLLPLAPQILNSLFSSPKAKPRFILHSREWGLFALIIILWLRILPNQLTLAEPRGTKVSETWFPVHSTQFIKQQLPQKNLYNFFNFGGYLIYYLPEYPVFYDGRETPFLKLDAERYLASRSPQSYSHFLKKYNINAIIESRPQEAIAINQFQKFYPSTDWARVFTDIASTVLVRRIPEHYKIIDQFESSGAQLKGFSSNKQKLPSNEEIQKLLQQANEEIRRRKSK